MSVYIARKIKIFNFFQISEIISYRIINIFVKRHSQSYRGAEVIIVDIKKNFVISEIVILDIQINFLYSLSGIKRLFRVGLIFDIQNCYYGYRKLLFHITGITDFLYQLPGDAMHSADYAIARCPYVCHTPVF